WKNLGMEVKNARGEWVTVDDPFLKPVFDHIEQSGKSLLMHIAEPLACWSPLVPGTPHFGYYSQHPEWHMHGKKDVLSHEALITSRDRILTRHPKLKIVGAHFGSMEYDVAVIAKCLDTHPNFAVDTSGRLRDLAYQDSIKVRQFFVGYQDRILFGTDAGGFKFHSDLSEAERKIQQKDYQDSTEKWYAYLSSDQELVISGKKTRGLGLPEKVLEKIYCTNALHWYPGLEKS
ncbi:MAG: amidohydrolase family protein, partial [Spirochaetia bacterium]|nr:amidohydrolase family protein [Spirochaetia bacterium]